MRARFWPFLVIVLVMVFLGVSPFLFAQPRVFLRFNLRPEIYISIPRSPQITLSIDRGEGANYFIGDPLRITYRTTREGYINLIDYLPDGDVRILVRDELVRGGVGNEYRTTVSGPGGEERLVILFTPNPVSESLLEEFIRAPHQGSRIFGGRYAVDRISFHVMSRLEATTLTIEPASVTIGASRSLVFTAVLRTSSGRPLAGRELLWSVDGGLLSSSRTLTDPQGRSRNTFYAPSFAGTVHIQVSFSGDIRLAPSQAVATVEVGVRPLATTLRIEPSSFTMESGGNIRLNAFLEDEDGNPLPGQKISWEGDAGSFSARSTTTDATGKTSVVYSAPSVTEGTSVEITASFGGTSRFSPSSATVSVEVLPPLSYALNATLFYVDFGGDTIRHNGDNLRYTGRIVSGFGANEVSFLEMRSRDAVEFVFSPGGLPTEGSILLWMQGEAGARARLTLNGKRLGVFPVERDVLSPTEEYEVVLSQKNLVGGENRLRIEVDPQTGKTIRLQKVIVAF